MALNHNDSMSIHCLIPEAQKSLKAMTLIPKNLLWNDLSNKVHFFGANNFIIKLVVYGTWGKTINIKKCVKVMMVKLSRDFTSYILGSENVLMILRDWGNHFSAPVRADFKVSNPYSMFSYQWVAKHLSMYIIKSGCMVYAYLTSKNWKIWANVYNVGFHLNNDCEWLILQWPHLSMIACQISGITTMCSTCWPWLTQKEYQNSVVLATFRIIHWWMVVPLTKVPWCVKRFHVMPSPPHAHEQ